MTDERKHFLQRIAWTLLPGIVAGLITGGLAWGTIQTQVQYLQRDIERIEDKTNRNTRIMYELIADKGRDHD